MDGRTRIVECQYCGKECKSSGLHSHERYCDENPNEEDSFSCEYCEKGSFTSKAGYKGHVRNCKYNPESSYKGHALECDSQKCDQKFVTLEKPSFDPNENHFCSNSCARSFATQENREEINQRISETLKRKIKNDREFKEEVLEDLPFERKTQKIGDRSDIDSTTSNSSAIQCPACGENWVLSESDRKYCSHECHMEDLRVDPSESRSKYRKECKFDFNLWHYPEEFDLDLIREHGMYRSANMEDPNLNGVVRDHRVSIMYGWRNEVDPEVISHPANCELMLHKENISKNDGCSITVKELKRRIEEDWEEKYSQ